MEIWRKLDNTNIRKIIWKVKRTWGVMHGGVFRQKQASLILKDGNNGARLAKVLSTCTHILYVSIPCTAPINPDNICSTLLGQSFILFRSPLMLMISIFQQTKLLTTKPGAVGAGSFLGYFNISRCVFFTHCFRNWIFFFLTMWERHIRSVVMRGRVVMFMQ